MTQPQPSDPSESQSTPAADPQALAPPQGIPVERYQLVQQLESGASWFFWLAGLSVINSAVSLFSGGTLAFIFGLGSTQIVDAFGNAIGGAAKLMALLITLIIATVFIVFGIFARKGHLWSFITGMLLYGLDGLLSLAIQDWLGFAVHLFVLYCLFSGFSALQKLRQLGSSPPSPP
jgi:hypothetical protein